MLFNSLEFAIFLPFVFLVYWFVLNRSLKLQNIFLLIASYFFYGIWDYRFLLLLILVSTTNYFIGIKLDKDETDKKRRMWLGLGLLVNLGVLGVFKYYNFFVDSFIDLITLFGYHLPKSTTRIILPLGISFYTFLSLSYILDIYKKNLKAHKNIIEVLLTLSFFPIILAGPIQRPSNLLPQIMKRREFDMEKAKDGLRQILWGLFKKLVIADNCAKMANQIFGNYQEIHGPLLFLGAIYFAFQLYCDFSGYSDVAIGTARLLGFDLMRNFAYPYFARDIAEFWRRWHISLTTWFRDYLFLPLSVAVSRGIKKEKVFHIKADLFIYIIASIVTWFLTGLWHGANFTYIVWGMIHGFFLILYQWQKQPRKRFFKKIGIKNSNSFIVFFETIVTLFIVLLAWIFFRSLTMGDAFGYIGNMFSFTNVTFSLTYLQYLPISLLYFFIEWLQRDKQHALEINTKPVYFRWVSYLVIIAMIFYFGVNTSNSFLYFQF